MPGAGNTKRDPGPGPSCREFLLNGRNRPRMQGDDGVTQGDARETSSGRHQRFPGKVSGGRERKSKRHSGRDRVTQM